MMPYMLLAIGLGLSGYYGLQWWQLPHYSEAELQASTELNLRLDLQARGESSLDAEAMERRGAQVAAELRADIARERSEVETGLGAGLIALVVAAGNFVLMLLLRRDTAVKHRS